MDLWCGLWCEPVRRRRDHPHYNHGGRATNLGDSSVDFLVRVWCDASVYFGYRADMTRKVKEALDEGGIDIPFPTRTMIQAS